MIHTPLIYKEHVSQQDLSVNFEHRFEDHPGMLEARYVRRTDDYFIVYLSSQTGCNQACRMCHLTATGQNKLRDVTIEEYWDQAERVLTHYAKGEHRAKMVHFNFMARGEPLANKIFLENADTILDGLRLLAQSLGLQCKFLISTIFPKEAEAISLPQIFKDPNLYPEIYYSIYSVDERFRKRWLPKAIAPVEAIAKLRNWQMTTGKKPKIHYAFINDENDTLADVKNICDLVERFYLNVNWNVVRYNPPEGHSSKEALEGQIQYLAGYVRRRFPDARVKVIPRVGLDVKASCGTFLK
ncbi:ribosomal RNA large subunit methyltransferase N [Pseudomonas phage D6]|nr:ribosomal RNA large subunit methyltransferase N [Pseudomonas phage D6]